MVRKLEVKNRSISSDGITCVGEVCFTGEGILVKIPADVDPECARKTADYILSGKKVQFQVDGGPIKTEDEMIKDESARRSEYFAKHKEEQKQRDLKLKEKEEG